MTKVHALVSKQGTACLETALYDYEDTPKARREIEKKFCKLGWTDDPIVGSWTDVSANDAFR